MTSPGPRRPPATWPRCPGTAAAAARGAGVAAQARPPFQRHLRGLARPDASGHGRVLAVAGSRVTPPGISTAGRSRMRPGPSSSPAGLCRRWRRRARLGRVGASGPDGEDGGRVVADGRLSNMPEVPGSVRRRIGAAAGEGMARAAAAPRRGLNQQPHFPVPRWYPSAMGDPSGPRARLRESRGSGIPCRPVSKGRPAHGGVLRPPEQIAGWQAAQHVFAQRQRTAGAGGVRRGRRKCRPLPNRSGYNSWGTEQTRLWRIASPARHRGADSFVCRAEAHLGAGSR